MQLFYIIRFPFKMNNSIGFSLGVLSMSVCSAVYIILFSILVSLDIGLSCYACACFHAFEHFALEIEQISCNEMQCAETLRLHLFSMIKFHVKTFNLLNKIQQIKSGPYFQQLCTYTVFIAHSLNSPVSETMFKMLMKMSILWCFTGYRRIHS